MILDRPWALVLLSVPAVLLWLRFRAARPRTAEASSLLVWRKVSLSDTPAGRPRPPLSAWLEAAGAALVVLAMADPGIPGAAPGVVRVVLDTSVSMHAKGKGGRERIEAAREALAGSGAAIQESTRLADDLPALLAAGAPVVVVTDHRLPGFEDDPPRLRIVGVGEPGFNAGFTAAAGEPLPGGGSRVLLAVETSGTAGPVEGTLRVGGRVRTITLAPGRRMEVEEEFAPGEDEEIAALSLAGDVLPADDAVRFLTRGTREVHFDCRPDLKDGPLARALEAAGAIRGGEASSTWGIALYLDPAPAGWGTLLFLPASADGPIVEGVDVTASPHALTEGVAVDPSASMGRRADTGEPGDTLLSDSRGPLVTADLSEAHGRGHTEVHFRFLPGGTWVERDPSFVVLAQNLVEWTRWGPPRVEGTGVLDPAETREAAEGETFGDLAAALREAALPDPADRRPLAVILFLAGGVLLAGAWLAAR